MKTISSLLKVVKAFILWQLNSVRNQLFTLSSSEKKYSKFHSQFGEDRWIFEHVDLPDKGVFVDIGAGHPIALSNTYFFEQKGWTGICIDADPAQCERLIKESANVEWAAIASKEGKLELSPSYLPALSSTLGKNEHNRGDQKSVQSCYPSSLSQIEAVDFEEQMSVLREAADMGHTSVKPVATQAETGVTPSL